MPIPATQFIWFNGKLVPGKRPRCMCFPRLHYGSSVFEEGRARLRDAARPGDFRLRDHTRRLFDSAKIYRINMPLTAEQLNEASVRSSR